MAKLKTKTFLIHLTVWSFWYLLNSLELVGFFSKLTVIHWIQLAYNYLSLVIVFYCVAKTLQGFFDCCFYPGFSVLNDIGPTISKFKYNIVVVIFIGISYIGLSVFLDGNLFGYEYPTLLSNITKRYDRVLPYIVAAILYACLRSYRKRQRQKDFVVEKRIKSLQTEIYKIDDLYQQLASEKSHT